MKKSDSCFVGNHKALQVNQSKGFKDSKELEKLWFDNQTRKSQVI
jgi:hypothetical protein